MDNLDTWLVVIGGIFGLVGLLGGSLAVVRSSYTRTQLEILRASVADYEKRTDQLIRERTEADTREATLQAKFEAAQREVQVLRDIVTSKQEIQDLRALIELNHKENQGTAARVHERLARVLKRLGDLEDEATTSGS